MASSTVNQAGQRVLLVGEYDPTPEKLDYLKKVIARIKENGQRIVVGDNPNGIDPYVVQYARELGFGLEEVEVVHPFKTCRIDADGFMKVRYMAPSGFKEKDWVTVFKLTEVYMCFLADLSMSVGRSPSAWNIHCHMGMFGKRRYSTGYKDNSDPVAVARKKRADKESKTTE